MRTPRTLIYDCEIAGDPTVLGWRNFEKLGLTVIGTWRNWPIPQYRAYRCDRDGDFDRFQTIVNRADEIVGFNSHSFDDPLCAAHGIQIESTIDLLAEVRVLTGMPRHYVRGKTRAGYSLERLALANLGRGKTGTGANAPKLWQAGKKDEVVAYCLNDIKLTKALYDRWLDNRLIDPTNGEGLGDCFVKEIGSGLEAVIAMFCGLSPIPEKSDFSGWIGNENQMNHFEFICRQPRWQFDDEEDEIDIDPDDLYF